ncbi:MAG: 50S ribosomal protein L11 methyltransferase [Opitutales bacterium]
MIRVTCGIAPDLVGALEDHLCEWKISPWVIITNRLNGEGSLDGYFSDQGEAEKAWKRLKILFMELPDNPQTSFVDDQNWKDAYKEHFHPWQTGSFHLVPMWQKESYAVPFGHKALYLDPGMAFGTGNHETTRLCLHALIEFMAVRKDIASLTCVDAGCGSGILALAAKLLGLGQVKGFDLDPDAVRIAQENAMVNEMSEQVAFACVGLETGMQPDCADLLLANVQADVLCAHCVALLTALRPRGILCLSGILSKEINEVERIFEKEAKLLSRSVVSEQRIDGEWASLTIRSNC